LTPRKARNIIILTNGLAGSSVLTGLLAQLGYWLGAQTFTKKDYLTYENLQLIELNKRLFVDFEYEGDYEMVFRPEDVSIFQSPDLPEDTSPYLAFLEQCDKNRPWLWKDPRLWLTIHFWVRYLDMDDIAFIVLTREPLQSWISSIIRRHIQTPAACRRYILEIRNSMRQFLEAHGTPYLEIVYEDLLLAPDETLRSINSYLDSDLTVADLERVFRGSLGERQRGIRDFLKAVLIYLYNYRRRYR
jgi:hypothetical protein